MVSSPVPHDPLQGVLAIGRALRAGGGDPDAVLAAVAEAVRRATGFRGICIDRHRPAWDDFEVVLLEGDDAAREQLLGKTTTWAEYGELLQERFNHGGAYFIPAGSVDCWDHEAFRPSSFEPSDDPDAWHPMDLLLVPLMDSGGEMLAVVSIDEPDDGRRPDAARLELVAAVCDHAAAALEHVGAIAAARRHSAAVEHLLRVSAQMQAGESSQDLLAAVCSGIRDALGFTKVVVELPDADGLLVASAAVGWDEDQLAAFPTIRLGDIVPLLAPELQHEGCTLLELEDALRLAPSALHDIYPSPNSGRGPRAWDRHWLIVPLHDRAGEVIGVIWADDPADRLLPTPDRLQALRAFANQAAAAIESANQLAGMRHLAEHDPLTGLRNRRGFQSGMEAGIAAGRTVSLLICDLDNFKRVNDSLGHGVGDRVLEAFAGLLRTCTRLSDVPTRLGGEEFALVLPDADGAAAMAVAERLRRSVRDHFADHPAHVSVSVGVATTGPELTSAGALMRAANRGLYAAKHLGRDRCVAYHAQTLEMLDAVREADGAAREQLAAAMLLAETLDLRDVGTARHSETVGRYAEQIARALGWDLPRVERVRAAGILHDIGKLGISDAILHKPGRLEPHEWDEMRRHPELGARILEHANLRDIAGWVLAHHERVDGAGYPRGLAGDDIPAESRILAVADAYEAMTADRPYRRALPEAEARAELLGGAGAQFDARVVEAFLGVLAAEPVPSL